MIIEFFVFLKFGLIVYFLESERFISKNLLADSGQKGLISQQ
jgi:hypothetical protein